MICLILLGCCTSANQNQGEQGVEAPEAPGTCVEALLPGVACEDRPAQPRAATTQVTIRVGQSAVPTLVIALMLMNCEPDLHKKA